MCVDQHDENRLYQMQLFFPQLRTHCGGGSCHYTNRLDGILAVVSGSEFPADGNAAFEKRYLVAARLVCRCRILPG